MDHLPLSKHSHPARVKYVCSDNDPYDGGDFATYPIRVGWPELLTSHTGRPFFWTSRDTIVDDVRMKEQEQMLMAWIFFGLLHTILSPFARYNATDYIEDHAGKRWLHTRGLKDRLAQWQAAMQVYDDDAREALIVAARNRYSLSVEAVSALDNPAYAKFDRMVKASLQAMCNTLEGMIVSWLSETYAIQPALFVTLDTTSRECMLGNGWCPSDITLIQASSTFSISWFAQHLTKTSHHESHSDCDDISCRRSQIDLEHYEPQHDQADCQCESLGPNLSEIVDCLRDDDIPVLEVTGEHLHDVAVSVRRLSTLEEDTSYVAFSHVWADGLGNPREMSLPRCQLLSLNSLVQGLKSHTFYKGTVGNREEIVHKQRLFLLCDTLCCPVESQLKEMALARMRDVYEKAEFVLVLDCELQACDYASIDLLEVGWRIAKSRRMKRLWKYQEAGLARRLLVQFADKPIDILPTMVSISRMYKESPYRDRLFLEVSATLVSLRNWMHSQPRTAWISEAVLGLAHWRVTVPSDEPLCLSTVLGLDNSQVVRARPEESMQLIWRLLCQHQRGVTKSVIFNNLGRMRTPEFRWAPQSFLQSTGALPIVGSPQSQRSMRPYHTTLDLISRVEDGKTVPLLNCGLQVQCAGWRVRTAARPRGIPKEFGVVPFHTMLPAQHPDGTCYNIIKTIHDGIAGPQNNMLETITDGSKEWFIILEKTATFEWAEWNTVQRALLVSKELHECGLLYYQSHMIVSVDRVEPRLETPRQVEYIYSEVIRRSWAMRCIGLLTTAETSMVVAHTWLPKPLGTTITTFLQPLFNACGRELGKRLGKMMSTHLADAVKQPVARRLWQAAGRGNEIPPGADIISAVAGRYVNIEEVFDASTEWIVD